jgi:ribosomal protein L16 Arg81 hydroxylase
LRNIHYLKKAKIERFVIKKGQTLFIPPGWWHYIEYTSSGYGISIKSSPKSFKYLVNGLFNVLIKLPIDNALHTIFPTVWNKIKER